MRSFQKKGRLKHIMQSKPFLVFLGILTLFFLFSMFDFMNKMEETVKNRKMVEGKIEELEKSKENLNSDIGKLKTEEGIEENIRDKFGLAREGENMILVVDDKDTAEKDKNSTDSSVFWDFFKNWLRP